MAENVIDTLKLDIIVNTKQNGQSITTLRNSLEKLYKFLNGVNSQDFSKVSNDIAKIGNSLTPLVNAVNSLNSQGTKNLNSLSNALKKIKEFTAGMSTQDISSLDKNLVQVSNSLAKFVSSLNSLDETGLKNIKIISSLSTLSSGLNRLDKTIDGLDVEKLKKKFTQMAEAIDPFITKVSSAKESLVALNNVMGGANKLPKEPTPKQPKEPKKKNNLLNFGSMVAKLYFVRNITKQLGQNLAKVVQYGIDYEETLNLWQTAMRGNISQARIFVGEMNKAYGISSATLMNYQATFKNMLGALGNISEDTAYGLSEAMTQMALDFASLYNVSVESAMTKFQAVLSGQVRPIRTAGYDITEQTLFQLYQQLGGTKTVRQLNQTEKQLLRILAVYEQMKRSGATGDLAKTLASSANQIRMMNEQTKEFATWIGIGFNTLMEKSGILVTINAGLYVATELAKSLAYSLGYVETDWGIEFADGVEEGEKEVENLKKSLLGFDKFQVLQSASGTDDGTDVTQSLLDAIKDYQKIYEGVENPAVAKGTKFLEMLGGELVEVKNEAGEVIGYIWQFPPALTETIKLIGSLAAALAIIGLVALEKKLWSVVKGITGVGNAMTLLRVGGLGLLIYGLTNLITRWDELSVGAKVLMFAITGLGVAITTYTALSKLANIINSQSKSSLLLLELAYYKVRIAASLAATAGIALLVGNLMSLITARDDMSEFERVVSIFGAIGAAALAAAAGIAAFHNAWTVGTASVAIIGGLLAIGGAIASYSAQMRDIEKHADGGLATKGSLFYAGEAGPELVTRTSGGNSTIMNMKQLEDAVARGFVRGFASTDNSDNNETTEVYVDGQRMFNVFRGVAKRNGYDLVRV